MRTTLLILIVLAIALAIFNPGMDEFREFVSERAGELVLNETGDSMLGRALSGAAAGVAREYVDRVTERRNFVLFSTYEIDFDGDGSDDEEWRFLGIGGQFLELERPNSVE